MDAQRAPGWKGAAPAVRRRQAVRLSNTRTHAFARVIGTRVAAALVLAAAGLAFALWGLPPGGQAPEADGGLTAPSVTDQPTTVPTPPPATRTSLVVPTVASILAPTPTPRPLKGTVALTFDAGADRGYAEDILDLLTARHTPASFGITGEWARHNPDLVRRMAAEGHLVINHTLDHRSFTGLSDEGGGLASARRLAELEQADALIAPLIGHTTRPWYRLPYGDDDAQVAQDVAPAGFTRKVGWTVDSGGWRGWSAADIVSHCLQAAEPGAIYVLHVGNDSQDRLALGPIIDGLRQRGYGFATVAELP